MKKNRNTCHLTGEVLQKSYKIMKLTFIMIMDFTLDHLQKEEPKREGLISKQTGFRQKW